MKTNLFIAALSLSLFQVTAQKKDTGLIKYIHQDNLLLVEYNSVLAIDGRKSYYVTAQDSLGERGRISKPADGTIIEAESFATIKKTREHGFQVFNDLSKPDIYFSYALSLLAPLVYVTEPRPQHDWQFSNATKEVAGFTCKAATTVFRGRTYTCWYTSEIPLPFGPWKLSGLPGLILEAASEDGAYKITAVGVQFPSSNNLVPTDETQLPGLEREIYSMDRYIAYQRKFIKKQKENLKLTALKYNVKNVESKESDNYLEIFGEHDGN